MGIAAIFNDFKAIMADLSPTVSCMLTAEASEFHGQPPRCVWELALPGQDKFSRVQLAPGAGGTNTTGRRLWAREAVVNIHCWMLSGGTTSDGVEWPDDNETVTDGSVWLVQTVIQAIHRAAAGEYNIVSGGWAARTEANLGFVYVFQVMFRLSVFDLPPSIATPTSAVVTPVYSG